MPILLLLSCYWKKNTFLLLEKKLELGKLNNKSILPLPSNGAAMPKISELYPG